MDENVLVKCLSYLEIQNMEALSELYKELSLNRDFL